MSTFTATKSGPASDPTTFGGAAGGSVPASGDTVNIQGFSIYFDYNIGSTGVAINDTSSSDGYVIIAPGRTVKFTSLTGTINVTGAQDTDIEFKSSGSYHVG
jgi:hypothetical protein